ncbi:MAG: GntR family transcriptional regulator [Treponemataceae bacterium]|nr:GntR family transcriptional regulator [Treponemataceae bacterium]
MKVLQKYSNESSREYAYRTIRENIVELEIKPGSMISEQDIAQELNVSRTPVHEALLELSRSKIVDILPQRGCSVSRINLELVEEAVFVRRTIECAVIEEACRIATEQDLAEMRDNIRLQDFYLASKTIEKIMELDNKFHEALYRISNKMQCYYMVQLMNVHFDRLRSMSLYSVKEIKIVDDHRAIVKAMTDKDPALAKQILEKHLSRLHVDVEDIKAHYPEYFPE